MPNLARQSYKVSILVATTVIALQNLALQYWDVVRSHLLPGVLGLLLSAGITGVVFRLVMRFYEKTAWRWFRRSIVLSGRWRHTLSPADHTPNDDRGGEFVVLQTAFETKIVGGKNYDSKTRRVSHWKSLAVFDDELPDRSLWVIYQIERGAGKLVGGEGDIDRGLIRVHLDVDKRTGVTKMSGNYWDAGRSQHTGSFEAARE